VENILVQLLESRAFQRRYRIGDCIGRGGYSLVYRATQIRMERAVAVKVLVDCDNSKELKRFWQEGKTLAAFDHPNIVRIFDVGMARSLPFMAMELLSGGSLRDFVNRAGRVPWRRAVGFALDGLAGLAPLHAAGVLHRDVKPENFLFHADGTLKIADFGLVLPQTTGRRLTRRGFRMGTPTYMAPEVVRGEGASAATDVYSMGLVLYELLAGRPAFSMVSQSKVLRLQLQAEPTPIHRLAPDIPPQLVKILQTALHKDPTRRFPDASVFRAALQAVHQLPQEPARLSARIRRDPLDSQAVAAAKTPRWSTLATGLTLGLVLTAVRIALAVHS
jgi:serine/threonine protein kinase